MKMTKLYIKSGSCSLASHILLEESGLPYIVEQVNLATKVTESGADFNLINPKGYVPALVTAEGNLLTEGAAILQYVADLVPEKNLAPPNGSLARYELQGWLNFISSELHRSCTAFFHPLSSDAWKTVAGANLEKRLAYTDNCLSGKKFLLGDSFSAADAYLFTIITWLPIIKFDTSLFPHINSYADRVKNRKAVDAVLVSEGLKKAI